MPIRILSEVVASQIAAGEVVERPASVVKELIENALDAGATAITVEVEQGGKRLLRISDDGAGIPAEEASLAFARHATSKLQAISDLDSLGTLGFRGEALASIAAVSRVTMVTRHHAESTGVQLQVTGGERIAQRGIGAPVGTVVSVEDLFFNTPARLKFMKSESTERRHIAQLVTHYAMAYPHVRWRLTQDGRQNFSTTGSGDLADVIVEAFGLDTFRQMVEVGSAPLARPDLPMVSVYGFTSLPELTRANRSQIILFVNGRAVVDQNLAYAVLRTYHNVLPAGRYPMAVLLITTLPEDVDVNVHPTKAEVRFRYPDAVFSAVQRAVRLALGEQPYAASRYETSNDWRAPSAGDSAPGQAVSYSPPPRPIPGEGQLRLSMNLPPERVPESEAGTDPSVAIPAGPDAPPRPRTLPILRVIGQVGAMYIVAEGPAGLYLLDQHTAHRRVLFTRFMDWLESGCGDEPVEMGGATVEIGTREAAALENSAYELARLGIMAEPFGGGTWRLRSVARTLAGIEPQPLLAGLAQAVLGCDDDPALCLARELSALAAYKAGQALNFEQMQGLVQQLERCPDPQTDPDGSPTMLHISGDDLARQFSRR